MSIILFCKPKNTIELDLQTARSQQAQSPEPGRNPGEQCRQKQSKTNQKQSEAKQARRAKQSKARAAQPSKSR